jgi:predicted nucleic acid-binding Zn ribbon protein
MKNASKLFFILIVLMAIGCKNETQNTPVLQENTASAEILVEAVPKALHKMNGATAFALKPSEIYSKDSLPKSKEAYCVIMDVALNDKKTSIVAFKTGEATFSINNMDLQFEKNPQSFNSLSTSLVEKAEKSLSQFTPTTTREEPNQNQVKIYVLTGDNKYVYENKITELKKNKEIQDIFESAMTLFSESRKAL